MGGSRTREVERRDAAVDQLRVGRVLVLLPPLLGVAPVEPVSESDAICDPLDVRRGHLELLEGVEPDVIPAGDSVRPGLLAEPVRRQRAQAGVCRERRSDPALVTRRDGAAQLLHDRRVVHEARVDDAPRPAAPYAASRRLTASAYRLRACAPWITSTGSPPVNSITVGSERTP